jgi:uncharacterized protein YyaL (SSP411 family)
MRQLLLALSLALSGWASVLATLEWNPWSADVFARAKREDRFVLLDLEAVWCHWCHVMDAITYQNPAAVALLKSKYIAVKVDQDSRPDLASRYEDYGWPATIVFDRDGGEIVKRALARAANAVWRAGGDAKFRKIAEEAMRYVVPPRLPARIPPRPPS